jgi:hypothetical protein
MSSCPSLSPRSCLRDELVFTTTPAPTVPHGIESAASTLPPHGCPRVELVEALSPRRFATPKSWSCSHSHAPVARAVSLSCARLSSSVARAQSRSATSFHRQVSFAMNDFAISVSRAAKRTVPSGFPDDSAGPIHGPRSHEARSLSRFPAGSNEPHCTGRPYSKADLTAQFPRR